MQAFRALIAAAPAVRSLPFVRSLATRTFAALGPKAGTPPTPAAPAAAKPAASASLATKAASKPSSVFAGIFGRKSAPRKMKSAPAKKKNAAGKVLVKRKSKFSIVMPRKPSVAAKASSAPIPVKNAVKAKSAEETARRFVVAGGTSKKAPIRVPNDPLRMSGIKFLRSVKHKLIAGRSKTLKLSERTQSKMASNLASEKKRLGVKKAIAVPKTVTMQALGL